jgi:hypothetical protein
MVAATKKTERIDLEKIALQLARVKISAIAGEEQLTIRANAIFTTRTFSAGKYKVAVGIRQALLHLDHPSFELENAYQATLAKETWSQRWKNLRESHATGSMRARFGAKFFGVFGLSVEGQAGKESRERAEQQTNAPYRIVSTTPGGWRIGTELGDPRAPDGALPDGLEHCLNGEYITGRHEEQGDGLKDKTGAFALCVLKAKSGGNDPHIVATLFGVTGSLRVAVTLSDPANAPHSIVKFQKENREREEVLRKAFIDICLERAEAAHRDGARTDAMISGEFYLSHHDILSPKFSRKVPSEVRSKTGGNQDG